MTTESAVGVKLGRTLESKLRILDNFVELDEYSSKKTAYHSAIRSNRPSQEQSFMLT